MIGIHANAGDETISSRHLPEGALEELLVTGGGDEGDRALSRLQARRLLHGRERQAVRRRKRGPLGAEGIG